MSMFEDFSAHELEANITDEMALAESSRPDDPVVESDRGWRPNPTSVKAYEARLLALRGALKAVEGDQTLQADVMIGSLTAIEIERKEVQPDPIVDPPEAAT
jgi:hypothetical protein